MKGDDYIKNPWNDQPEIASQEQVTRSRLPIMRHLVAAPAAHSKLPAGVAPMCSAEFDQREVLTHHDMRGTICWPSHCRWCPGKASRPEEPAVCEKCVEIDRTIDRYRQIQRTIMDEVTVDRTKQLIADLEGQKAALHPPLR